MESGLKTATNLGKISLDPTEAELFYSIDYFVARDRFRAKAAQVGWELKSYLLDVAGPRGEELTVDVALSPGRSSAPVLVVSSGLHGVEGIFGSAVQLAWLNRYEGGKNHPIRQVLVHSLNPHGFAWGRRVNDANIDLNRNFLSPPDSYTGFPEGYRSLDPFLNPQRPLSVWDPFTLKAVHLLARHGKTKLQQAIAVGQYEYPQGLFFGGSQPAWQFELLSEHYSKWIADSRDVFHFDLHTGLGPWGKCNILIDYPLGAQQLKRLQSWFGSSALDAYKTKTVSYQAKGGLGQWLNSQHPDREFLFAFAEFGTYGPVSILKGLRAENQAHHWDKPSSPRTRKTKARLRELFCPADPSWRQSVLNQSLELLDQALQGLQEK